MKKRTDCYALSFGLQATGILFVCFFPLIVWIEAADTMVIFSSVFTESINQGKAQFHPILVFRCDVNGTLFYFANDTFYFFLLLLEVEFGAGSKLGDVGTLFSKGTFSQSWAENIFFDILVVFRVNICLWVVWQETGARHIASRHIHLWQSGSTDAVGNSLEKA
jgi:hypothetical protein